MALAIVKLLAAHLVGFLAPGYPLARLLGVRPVWCGAFTLSWLSLVLGVILFQIAGLPLTAGSLSIWQLAVMSCSGALWLRQRHELPPPAADTRPDLPVLARSSLIGIIALVGLTMAWRLALAPLAGDDTLFRWDLLPRAMLEHGNLSFYPPSSAADYRTYFIPDAIAPAVAAPYWWIYAAWGKAEPVLTGGFVLAQWLATIGFVWQATTNLAGRSAGWLAAALLAGSAFFLRSVAIGQDAGATALGLSGALAALTLEREVTRRHAIAAALLSGVGVLVREYGPAVAVLAATTLAWPPRRWKLLAGFAAVVACIAAPWTLRNLVRLGHPFHSVPLAPFAPAAPVYAQILEACKVENAPFQQPWEVWRATLLELLRSMPVLAVLGPIAALALARRHAWLPVGLGLAAALWVQAIAISHGGMLYTTRVLTPAAALAAVAVGVGSAQVSRRQVATWLAAGVTLAHGLWGAFLAASFPFDLPPASYADVPGALMTRYEAPREERALPGYLQSGSRVLSENAYAHALLAPVGIDVVPIWSPEVAFVFDESTPPLTVRERLRERGIGYVLYSPESPNARICERYAFFAADLPLWTLLLRSPGGLVLYRMPQ